MKTLLFSFIIGLILLYFVNIATLKTAFLNQEWAIHAGIRFLLGFFVLGVSFFYQRSLKFKTAIYITLGIVVLDYFYDYYVESYRLNFEIILHGIYMLIWGALLGYLTAKYLKEKINENHF